jgi:CRP/FNR family cyclic AMP-dependent transcriptional regulator
MSFFDGFTDTEVAAIKAAGTEITLPSGWSPIWESTPSDKAYILLEGEVSIRKNGDEIARLGAGDVVGETSILNHSLRNASVVSLTPLKALHYTRECFEKLDGEVPKFHEAVERAVRERTGTE